MSRKLDEIACVSVPLLFVPDGEVHSVLLITSTLEQGAWTAHERELLKGAARTVGLALEWLGTELLCPPRKPSATLG